MKRLDSGAFSRNIQEIYTSEGFQKKLAEERPLRIKYGVDVTAPFLHIGHAVNLWKMREMQEVGHKVILLIGDFTTTVGDPTGQTKTRAPVDRSEIEKNAKEFIRQATLVLKNNRSVFEVRRNSEWYKKMRVEEFLSLLSLVTHSKLIERDMFQERIRRRENIFMHEILYPVLQGYDSVMLESDLTIVGTDQLFNELVGRFYQEKFSQSPQIVMTTRITPGLDGNKKQSKSLGNYVALTDAPGNKFGKIMSLPDGLVGEWLEVYTDLPDRRVFEIKKLPPFEAKKELAKAVVARYHGAEQAQKEEGEFLRVFSEGELPENIKTVAVDFSQYPPTILDVVFGSGLVGSRSEARRLLGAGAVEIDGGVKSDPMEKVDIKKSVVLRVGKKRFARIVRK